MSYIDFSVNFSFLKGLWDLINDFKKYNSTHDNLEGCKYEELRTKIELRTLYQILVKWRSSRITVLELGLAKWWLGSVHDYLKVQSDVQPFWERHKVAKMPTRSCGN
jgi:hypothetical protein